MSGQEPTAGKLYDALQAKTAPAQIGKPVFARDLEMAKACGAYSMAHIIGSKDVGDQSPHAPSLNFGSKNSVGIMTDESRIRLFTLKRLVSAVEIQAQIMTRNLYPTPAEMEATPLFKQHLAPMLKAFDVSTFSSWIPTVNARFYFEEFEIPLIVSNLFDQMPMESATVTVPGALGLLFGKLETDSATFTAQSNTNSSFTVASKNNVVHAQITEDLQQDSAPAIIAKLQKEVAKGVARSLDRTLINGDDTGSHMDSDVTAATDFRKAYKGLRKLALANSGNGSIYDHSGDSPNSVLWKNLLLKMGKFASEKGDLAFIQGPFTSNMLVTGAIPELFTAYAFGAQASNVSGQMPPIYGIQAVESEYVREDVNASGVYDGVTVDKTTLILVKKSRFQNYLRQAMRMWAAPSLPSSDLMLMSAKHRGAFAGNPQSATEKSVVIAYNVQGA